MSWPGALNNMKKVVPVRPNEVTKCPWGAPYMLEIVEWKYLWGTSMYPRHSCILHIVLLGYLRVSMSIVKTPLVLVL